MSETTLPIPPERIERSILLLRGEKVMLDSDLAKLYGVSTKALVQAVKRNQDRFPADFLFQLTAEEFEALRSQIVTSKNRGGRRYLPFSGRDRLTRIGPSAGVITWPSIRGGRGSHSFPGCRSLLRQGMHKGMRSCQPSESRSRRAVPGRQAGRHRNLDPFHQSG